MNAESLGDEALLARIYELETTLQQVKDDREAEEPASLATISNLTIQDDMLEMRSSFGK